MLLIVTCAKHLPLTDTKLSIRGHWLVQKLARDTIVVFLSVPINFWSIVKVEDDFECILNVSFASAVAQLFLLFLVKSRKFYKFLANSAANHGEHFLENAGCANDVHADQDF